MKIIWGFVCLFANENNLGEKFHCDRDDWVSSLLSFSQYMHAYVHTAYFDTQWGQKFDSNLYLYVGPSHFEN
jgi:surface polysaccharide O-acyltransferase-like enzyme